MVSTATFAEDPASKASQCDEYGSYQDAEGQWNSCEMDDMDGMVDEPEYESSEEEEYEEEPMSDEPYE
jgi:hypothetical protein